MQEESRVLRHSNGIGIHTVFAVNDRSKPTLLFLPGMPGIAEEGFACLAPCLKQGFNVASISFRGRGQSSTPEVGYTFDDHVDDLKLVLQELDCSKVVLVANSISTIYAVKYLLRGTTNPVVGLVIADHPLKVNKLREGWADDFAQITVRGESVLQNMRKLAMTRIELESEAIDMYADFESLRRPTVVMVPQMSKGILKEQDIVLFARQKCTEIIHFEKSDHIIRYCEPEKFRNEIVKFASKCFSQKHG